MLYACNYFYMKALIELRPPGSCLFSFECRTTEIAFPALNEFDNCLKKLERVEGIEPSYSAWKAAALPLSYTRARPINYHARQAASTSMRRLWPVVRRRFQTLNRGRFAAYTEFSINNERR
jgi:hypothetical protein